jgi:two-component system, NarL family, sensor histidine kinase UhpB
MSLFWRVFAANAAILTAGALVLAFAPSPLHGERALVDSFGLVAGLVVMLAVNGVLLRRLFRPLERLAERMEAADVLRGGQRILVVSSGEIGTLERTFNTMLERLERERRDSGARALAAQEEERQRIARGLHDEVGQSMTAVLLLLKRMTASATPEQHAQLAQAQQVVKASLEDVRRLAQELRPELLDHLGLASALESLGSGFEQRTHVRVRRQLERSLPPLDPRAELVIYRAAQESLTNVARHAQATEVLLSLHRGDNSVVLRVADDGQGFDPSSHAEGGGLRGIRERALIAGGTATITPGPGRGVEVRLEVPAEAA